MNVRWISIVLISMGVLSACERVKGATSSDDITDSQATDVCQTSDNLELQPPRLSDPDWPIEFFTIGGQHSARFASQPVEIEFPRDGSEIQFFYVDLGDQSKLVSCLTVTENGSEATRRVDAILSEGSGRAVIAAIFTASIKGERALVMLIRWRVVHRGLQTEGYLYQPYIYSYKPEDGNRGLRHMTSVEKHFGMGFDGVREGKPVHYKYKSEASIRRRLDQLAN